MTPLPPPPASKARELVVAVRGNGMDFFVDTVHAPECGIPDGEYWLVRVERVVIAPVRFDVREVYTATPAPEYEVA